MCFVTFSSVGQPWRRKQEIQNISPRERIYGLLSNVWWMGKLQFCDQASKQAVKKLLYPKVSWHARWSYKIRHNSLINASFSQGKGLMVNESAPAAKNSDSLSLAESPQMQLLIPMDRNFTIVSVPLDRRRAQEMRQ